MTYNKYLNSQEFVDNNAKRIPVCIVVDCSGSMREYDGTSKSRIERVNDGINLFYEGVRKNPKTKRAVDVLIIQVGNNAKILRDFEDTVKNPPELKYLTEKNNLTEGVELALDCLDKRKQIYKSANIDYYQPWLIIMSDGGLNREFSKNDFRMIQQEVREREIDGKLSVFPVYVQGRPVKVGENEYIPIKPETYEDRLKLMSEFSSNNNRLINIDLADSDSFEKLFQFLHKSASSVANNKGIINDSNYGNFQQNTNNNTNIPLYRYEEIDNNNDTLIEDDETDLSNINEELNKQQELERQRIKKARKELENSSNEQVIVQQTRRNNRIAVDVYVNDKKTYPLKSYDGTRLIMEIQLFNKDNTKIVTNDGKVIYNEIFHSDGRYQFVISENGIDVKQIGSVVKTSEKSRTIKNMNDEIEKIINEVSDWDLI